MKREDIFTTLHDRYNTISSSIQDPEAFHHDVYEISNVASSPDEFHRLLSDRKEQRIHELNSTLESASFEIIANPSLIGTEQWQLAVQLFRTRSLDSLVRYFASYLPDDHPWYNPQSQASSSDADTRDDPSRSTSIPASHFPPSPRSMTMCSDESTAVSPTDDDTHHDYSLRTYTPARTSSFSEPETDFLAFSGILSHVHDDETSQSAGPDTPITSESDFSETQSLSDYDSKDEMHDEFITRTEREGDEEEEAKETEEDRMASDTPTPRNDAPTDSYVDAKSTTSRKHNRSCSLHSHVLQEYVRASSRRQRRDGSPGVSAMRRRSPEVGRVQKPSTDLTRPRPKGLVHMSRLHSRYP